LVIKKEFKKKAMSEFEMPNDLAQTVIPETDFTNELFAPTEQDNHPPQPQYIPEPDPQTPKNSNQPETDDDIFGNVDDADMDVYVDGGLEIADALKDIACEIISGERDKVFSVNKKHFDRLKRHTKKIASQYVKNVNPLHTWYLLIGLCFVLPIVQAVMFRINKKKEAKQAITNATTPISSNSVKEISDLMNEKKPGRPSKAELELKDAWEKYQRNR